MAALYTAVARSTGEGRNGHVQTSDDQLDFDVRVPKELGGPGGATNPEQLFAAGYAACFHSALKLLGRQQKLDLTDSTVTAEVSLFGLDGGGYGLGVALDVHTNLDRETTQQLVQQAHQVCPYSNATRGNIEVTLSVH